MDTAEQEALIEKTVARVLASAAESAARNKTITRAAFDAMSKLIGPLMCGLAARWRTPNKKGDVS